jgi:hypothetical protein
VELLRLGRRGGEGGRGREQEKKGERLRHRGILRVGPESQSRKVAKSQRMPSETLQRLQRLPQWRTACL